MFRVVGIACLLSVVLPAQQTGNPQKPEVSSPRVAERASTGFVLEAGEHDVHDIVDDAAIFLGRNILCSAAETGQIQSGPTLLLQKKVEVDARGCEELLASLLFTKGLALVPLDMDKGFWEVINLYGQRRNEIMQRAIQRSPEEILRRPALKVVVQTVVPLKHIDATIATNAMRPFFATAGSGQSGLVIGNPGHRGSVLLLGYADYVASAIHMLRAADVPLEERDSNLFRLQQEVKDLGNRVTSLANGEPRVALKLADLQEQVSELQKAIDKLRKSQ